MTCEYQMYQIIGKALHHLTIDILASTLSDMAI